jgi:hypothetical protein
MSLRYSLFHFLLHNVKSHTTTQSTMSLQTSLQLCFILTMFQLSRLLIKCIQRLRACHVTFQSLKDSSLKVTCIHKMWWFSLFYCYEKHLQMTKHKLK